VPALFSALMVDLGVVMMVRLVLQVLGPGRGHHLLGLLTGLGIASALLGAVMALAQDGLLRLLAWDTVSQVGVMTVGFASATSAGVGGAVYHMVNHGMFKALLFLAAGAVVRATGCGNLSELGGLARRKPVVTACFTVGALAIAGMPGLNGYASLSLIHDGLEDAPAVLALAVLAQVITVAAFARACWLGFYRRREPDYEALPPTPRAGIGVLVTLAGSCVALGAAPYQLVRHVITPAAAGLLDAGGYAGAVLGSGGPVPAGLVAFSYGKPSDLALAAAEIVAGVLLAAVYLRVREPRPVTWLRRLHTGSVNDYAVFAAAGIVLAAGVLMG
jgi:multicomponent Na+:H+ antiporter subunit D